MGLTTTGPDPASPADGPADQAGPSGPATADVPDTGALDSDVPNTDITDADTPGADTADSTGVRNVADVPDDPSPQEGSDAVLLRVTDLWVTAPTHTAAGHRGDVVRAVSFALGRGEALGLVGESGSGKTLTCRALLGALPEGCVVSGGTIVFDGQDVTALTEKQWRPLRGARIGTVFQDPASYLNPSLTVGRQLTEVLRRHGGLGRQAARQRALELLSAVEIRDPAKVARQIPSRLSGGMQQRVMLAVAVSCEPDLLVADEPTTALDVRTQAEVLALLAALRARLNMSLLFVTHDLDIVAGVCDRIAVFHRGRIVETGPADEIVHRPSHPYTRSLVAAASAGAVPAASPGSAQEAPVVRV